MNSNTKFLKTISDELLSIKDRVRLLIGNANWAEEGKYKEECIKKYLRSILSPNLMVGTGFVKTNDDITKQIDIIVYDNKSPVYLKYGDFVILPSDFVYGIIEVKSKITTQILAEALEKAKHNRDVINSGVIAMLGFNGIFGFESDINFSNTSSVSTIKEYLRESWGKANHIVFNKDIFMKLWAGGNPALNDNISTYSTYRITDLAYGYFFSNMLEIVYSKAGICSIDHADSLYPLKEGKESNRLASWEIRKED